MVSDRGGGNTRGFTSVQTSTNPIATTDHQPIHERLQIAATSSKGMGIRL
jgi:hypothetical protein